MRFIRSTTKTTEMTQLNYDHDEMRNSINLGAQRFIKIQSLLSCREFFVF